LERKYKMFMKGSDAQSLEKVLYESLPRLYPVLYEAKVRHEHDISFIKHRLGNNVQ